jgi:hypothetical protein
MRLEGSYGLSTAPYSGSHYTGEKWKRVLYPGRVFRTPLVAFMVREVNPGTLRGGSSVGPIPWIGSVKGVFILRGVAASSVQDDLQKPRPGWSLRNRVCNPVTEMIGQALEAYREPLQRWAIQQNESPYYRGIYGGYSFPAED